MIRLVTYWASIIISGIVLSGIYSLAGLGFVVIYKATGVFNFAQGQLLMLAGYLFYLLQQTYGWNVIVAVIGVLLIMAVVGLASYNFILRPLATRPVFSSVIATLGLAILITAATGMAFGQDTLSIKPPWSGHYVTLHAGLQINDYDLFSLGMTTLVFGIFIGLFRWTRLGLQMRASATNPILASQRGINLNAMYGMTWALAAVAAGVAGMLYAGRGSVDQNLALLGISAFPAALIGGFDSVGGVALGALVIGISQSLATAIFGADTTQVVAGVVLIVVLIIRPQGIFGLAAVNRL